ncbi:MAG: hypothetical protein MJ094_06940 [Saccharofermentans sp.]|nr:hypothetical protein [Saccharofermentans sp.]
MKKWNVPIINELDISMTMSGAIEGPIEGGVCLGIGGVEIYPESGASASVGHAHSTKPNGQTHGNNAYLQSVTQCTAGEIPTDPTNPIAS